jgi:hypothetical protein
MAQNKQVLYGLEVPQSLLLNPGGKVSQGTFWYSLIISISSQCRTTGVNVFDIFWSHRKISKIRRDCIFVGKLIFFGSTTNDY